MTTIDRWIAHYTRLLAGSLSATERAYAEGELAYWQEISEQQAQHEVAA